MEGSGSVQVIANPGPGGPKIYGFCGSGSTTLEKLFQLKGIPAVIQINSGKSGLLIMWLRTLEAN
jgi:hypothetical protein